MNCNPELQSFVLLCKHSTATLDKYFEKKPLGNKYFEIN